MPISRKLLQKYDRPGPRYTSYPPANHFHAAVGSPEYERELERVAAGEPLSIYVHVPFCEHRCTYCGCFVVPTKKHSVSRRYLDFCLRELSLAARKLAAPARVGSIQLGGGTPTYLAPRELEDLFAGIRDLFDLTDGAEIAVELDPRVTTVEHLDALVRCGTNRVSMGVQDTSADVQEAIGRRQSREETIEFFHLCRAKGFRYINVDLVYGLPRQTPARFASTLGDILSLHPERFAIFGYAHVPWVRPHQKKIDPEDLPGAEGRLELYLMAHDRLTGAGYRHIGMDHFALPDDELSLAREQGRLGRNFMGYIPNKGMKIVGVGVSSIGDTTTGYFQNEKKLAAYYRRLENGELPIDRGFVLNADDVCRRHVIHEILCNLEVDFAAFEAAFGRRFEEYFAVEMDDARDLAADGVIELSDSGIRVTPVGVLVLRNIAMPFDRYLREKPPAAATYSRTV